MILISVNVHNAKIKVGKMTNYQKGYSFEADFVKNLREEKTVVLAERFHKSVGPNWKPDFEELNRFGNYKVKHAPIDCWYLTTDGKMHFVQNKRNVKISTDEMLDLVSFAMDMEDSADVILATKVKKQIYVWTLKKAYVK